MHPRRVPGAEDATADERKFILYLLNHDHPIGAAKARFFAQHGFSVERPDELRLQILAQLPTVEGRYSRESEVGTELWETTMTLVGLHGEVKIEVIWEVHPDKPPSFVTAYPVG